MKRLYVAEHPIEAKFVKDFLDSAGIAAVVRGEHLFALRGGVPMTHDTLPSVWLLHEEEYERARDLLARLQARTRLQAVDPATPPPADQEQEDEEDEESGGSAS